MHDLEIHLRNRSYLDWKQALIPWQRSVVEQGPLPPQVNFRASKKASGVLSTLYELHWVLCNAGDYNWL